MNFSRQPVRFGAPGYDLAGDLVFPEGTAPVPSLIVCHGAGEFKENYFELCESLAARGVASLALDLYGHGASSGERFHVDMKEWVHCIRLALDFLVTQPRIKANCIGAFGLSSGGTAILEAALVDPRLKALIALDPTVRNPLPMVLTAFLRGFSALGAARLRRGRPELRLPLAKMSIGPKLASDPVINKKILSDPRSIEAFLSFPLPGAEQAFFVDTLQRAPQIKQPTLVLWGEDDKLDPPKTGRVLVDALNCPKRLEVIRGNGHVGHLDRNRGRVFELTADWALENLRNGSHVNVPPSPSKTVKVIEGEAAKSLSPEEKWRLLAPHLRLHGREALAYATLQQGMSYFIDPAGYIAYTTVQHPVLAPKPRRITLSDPVCSREDLPRLLDGFLSDNPRASFGVISEQCADVLRARGFKVNCIGYEPELPVQTYNTQGNWKELDLVKRARNEAKREGITIREEEGRLLDKAKMAAVSAKWIASKKINDREIWLYARRPVFGHEEDVRKFVAYDRSGEMAGFVFYDPMYRDGNVFGYSANISRCDENRFGRLATAIHMEAIEKFRTEGKEVLNLLLAPFVKLDRGKFNDDTSAKLFFELSARFGNNIYNFKGLSFHKSKYRGQEKNLYCASNSAFMANDLYLAFVSADIATSYFSTMGQLLRGMLPAPSKSKSE